MKRFHVHVSVRDLPESVRFYSDLFGTPPVVEKPDYAKWMLDDPRVNFAISQRGRTTGINHLGFQVDSDDELRALRKQAAATDISTLDQGKTACCYARSDKYWVEDPQGIAWETFHTLGAIPIFGEEAEPVGDNRACCIPLARQGTKEKDACCVPTDNAKTGGACCG